VTSELVLVVDDDEDIRACVSLHLEAAGYRVETAKDGIDAIEAMRRSRPDALVLDVEMPRLDGFGLLQEVQTSGIAPFTPVLLLTARHSTSDVKRALELGATDFLAKPFVPEILVKRVGRMLVG